MRAQAVAAACPALTCHYMPCLVLTLINEPRLKDAKPMAQTCLVDRYVGAARVRDAEACQVRQGGQWGQDADRVHLLILSVVPQLAQVQGQLFQVGQARGHARHQQGQLMQRRRVGWCVVPPVYVDGGPSRTLQRCRPGGVQADLHGMAWGTGQFQDACVCHILSARQEAA